MYVFTMKNQKIPKYCEVVIHMLQNYRLFEFYSLCFSMLTFVLCTWHTISIITNTLTRCTDLRGRDQVGAENEHSLDLAGILFSPHWFPLLSSPCPGWLGCTTLHYAPSYSDGWSSEELPPATTTFQNSSAGLSTKTKQLGVTTDPTEKVTPSWAGLEQLIDLATCFQIYGTPLRSN